MNQNFCFHYRNVRGIARLRSSDSTVVFIEYTPANNFFELPHICCKEQGFVYDSTTEAYVYLWLK